MIAGAACHAARFWSDGQNLRHQQQSFDDLRRKNPPKASFNQKRLFVLLQAVMLLWPVLRVPGVFGGEVVAGGQFRRKLPTSCTTAGVATCFADASDGDEIELSAGTLSSGDGIMSGTQLTLGFKYASIACNVDGGACVWQGATGKQVVCIRDNGGTSTLSHLVIKDGDLNHGSGNGGGLLVYNANVVLILVAFIDNAASNWGGAIYVDSNGSSSVTLHGCSFSGNTAISGGPDVYNQQETVAIGGCPAGEPIRPSTLLQNH